MSETSPVLWMVAGPNGVGKTTYAYRHIRAVSGSVHFVNLDEIARGLSPLDPEVARTAAARVALERMREFIAGRVSFSLETTLAGRTHLQTIALAREKGFGVRLLFFIVPDVATCLARIARRVSEGGHNVPEQDVRRRYTRALANVPIYAKEVDMWRVFDNSGGSPRVVAEGLKGCVAMRSEPSGLPAGLDRGIATLPPCLERQA